MRFSDYNLGPDTRRPRSLDAHAERRDGSQRIGRADAGSGRSNGADRAELHAATDQARLVHRPRERGVAQSFGDPSADPYLATTLTAWARLLKNYFAVGHDSLDNYIAQISGQAPDHATENDCGVWTPFEPT